MNQRQTMNALRQEHRDAFCLISHASYILCTSGILWAVDPRLSLEGHQAMDDSISADLASLRVALVTHLHPDHYDEHLIDSLSRNDTLWIFPAFMPQELQKKWLLRLPRCVFVRPGDTIESDGLTIQVFESIHYDLFEGKKVGVPENGYSVQTPHRSLLFPGDIRDFSLFPETQKNADELFAHVWLGRQAALHPREDLIDSFCRYFASAQAKRIWLAHLNDTDRPPCDRWTNGHAEFVRGRMLRMSPGLSVEIPAPWQKCIF